MKRAPKPWRGRGFSLVELMVSVVVSLLALMFATRLVISGEQSKQSSLGGSDSMQNGMLALFSISGDAAQAGWGLNDPLIAGCNTVFNDSSGYVLATAARTGAASAVSPLAAALIESHGANPDRLSLYAGSSMSGTGTLRVTTTYASGTHLEVERPAYGFATDDVIVVVPETLGGNCALAQISSDPTIPLLPLQQPFLDIAAGSGRRFNTGNLGAPFTGSQARLFNLGPAASLAFHSWSVANGFLQLQSTDLAGSTLAASSASAATVMDNVVSIKAQYGFDTRAGAAFLPESGMQVAQWSASMIDADGDGIVGGAGDYQRIAALRLAVVARSKNPEKPGASGVCSATPLAPTVFSSTQPLGVTAQPITLNVAVAGDATDWKCYRYRVFETIVPMRNLGWRPTAL